MLIKLNKEIPKTFFFVYYSKLFVIYCSHAYLVELKKNKLEIIQYFEFFEFKQKYFMKDVVVFQVFFFAELNAKLIKYLSKSCSTNF